jgi:hypothetical protein
VQPVAATSTAVPAAAHRSTRCAAMPYCVTQAS